MSQPLKKTAPKRNKAPEKKKKALRLVQPVPTEQEQVITANQPVESEKPEASASVVDDPTSSSHDELDQEWEEAIRQDQDHLPVGEGVVSLPAEREIHEPLHDARLISHCGTRKLIRADLAALSLPEATETFQPVSHAILIDELEQALAFRHITIVRDEYAVSPDGMRLFSLLELNAEYEGVRFAIGLRNSNDKSMRLGMVAGYRVFICDNMALSGDFKPLLAKHSKHFDLVESLSIGVDRIQRNFEPLKRAIDFMRSHQITDDQARSIIYRAFLENRFPVKLMKAVHREFFIHPSYEEFKQRTVWSLSNAFTTIFKELAPVRQYEMTARLGKFLQPYTSAF